MAYTHEAQLWRGDDNILNHRASDFGRTTSQIDKWIQEIHSGIHGVGKFEIFMYELTHEGNLERCISQFQPIYVPKKLETA